MHGFTDVLAGPWRRIGLVAGGTGIAPCFQLLTEARASERSVSLVSAAAGSAGGREN